MRINNFISHTVVGCAGALAAYLCTAVTSACRRRSHKYRQLQRDNEAPSCSTG
jgi:hypothetical protein